MASSGTLFNTNKIPTQETLHQSYRQGVIYFSDPSMSCYSLDPTHDSLALVTLKSDTSVSYIKQEGSGMAVKINYITGTIKSNSLATNIIEIS